MSTRNGTKLILGVTILLIIILAFVKFTRPITDMRESLVANPKSSEEFGDSAESISPDDSGDDTKNGGDEQDPDNNGNPPEGGTGPGPEENSGPSNPGPAQSSSGSDSRSGSRDQKPRTDANAEAVSVELEEIVKPETENVFVIPETIKTSEGEVKIKISEPENRFIYTKILSFGSDDSNTDSSVQEVQKQLKNEGLFSSNTTGYFGQITFEAVKKFQQKHALNATGFVDLITNSYLNTSRNIEFSK